MEHKDNTITGTSNNKLTINISILAIAITLFTFIITFNSEILKVNDFLAIQLICSIPILFSSCITATKLGYTKKIKIWKNYTFILFTIGQALLINSIGILIAELVSSKLGIIFFVVSIITSILYSIIRIKYEDYNQKSRFYKDLLNFLIVILFGLLPILGII